VTHKFGDTALLRFYRGRKAVDEDVYKALVRHANWRKENDVDNIANEIYRFQKEMNAGKFVVEGYDTTGRPAIFIHARKHNKNDRDLEELRLLIIYTMETILKRTKPDEERMLICFDLTDFRLSCMDYDMVKLLISILEFNYPETLSSALIINAPFMFYACWAVIRPWLDPVTAAKVAFVNGDKLAEHITFTAPVAQASRVDVIGSSKLGSPIALSAASEQGGSSKANSSKALAEVHADFEAAFNQELNPNSPTLTISSQKSKETTGKKWWAWS
jgi:hypothetical protein